MGGLAKRNTKYQEILDQSQAQPEPGIKLVEGKPLPFHEDYLKMAQKWKFLKASYKGGAAYKDAKDSNGDDCLVKHEQESEKAWNRRKRLSTCHNFCRPLVDKMIGFVFSSPITRDSTPAFEEFSEDVDGQDMCLPEFMRECVLKACVNGRWFVMLDTTKPEPNMTLAQAKAAGSRIVMRDLDPCRVINWTEDELLVTDAGIGEHGGARLWDDSTYTDVMLGKDGKVESIAAPVPHGWASMPIVWVKPHSCGESMIEDIAELQMSIFNLDSILREELSKNTFSQYWLACPSATQDMLQAFDVGSRKVIVMPVDANSVKFERLSSDPSQAESLRQTIEGEVREIYRTMGLKDPTTESGPESGRALKIRFTESAFKASEISDMAEDAEEKVTDLVAGALGIEVEGPDYPDNFDDENLAEELNSTIQVIAADLPQTCKKAQVRKWADLAFSSRMEADELEEMHQEIEGKYAIGAEVETEQPEGEVDQVALGMAEEAKEHPGLDQATIGNLVRDHLKGDPVYYRKENLDARKYQNPAYAPGSKAPSGPMIG